jgi:hypothetical protein
MLLPSEMSLAKADDTAADARTDLRAFPFHLATHGKHLEKRP